jgi:ribose 5-phosphate isomerase A
MKELVAQEMARRVQDGDIIGVGTGSTVDAALDEIGKRIGREKLSVRVVPSSYQSAWRCQEIGLQVMYPGYRGHLSWGFDGADQVTRERWAIKGKGGALLQEKILAKRCRHFVIIVDESKVVDKLGEGCPIPVEVIPEGLLLAEEGLRRIGATELTLRSGSGKHGPIITERGNLIVDATFPAIHAHTEREIKELVGVVDSGLFTGYVSEVVIASSKGLTVLKDG